jgi:hypothetical protein
MVTCSNCGADPESVKSFARVASISGSIMGDEHIETLYYCQACLCYTIEYYIDRFCNEESVRTEGPVSKERGDQLAAIIARCGQPWDKKCRCPAHREYYGGGLD